MQFKKPPLFLMVLAWLPAIAPIPVFADDEAVSTLRAEIEIMRREYEARIAALEERLAKLEGAQRPDDDLAEVQRAAAAAVAGAGPTTAAPASESPPVGYERNLNRLNPEISVTGIVLASTNDPGRDEFQAQEFELDLQAALDPFSRARVTFAVGDEGIEIEEGYVSYSSLPTGLELIAGRFRQRWGVLNRQHLHALPQSDYPLVYQSFFGEEGLVQTGMSFNWLLPRLWASSNEITIELTNGENEVAFAGELFDDFTLLGRFSNYWDLSAAAYLEWGLSGITGSTASEGVSRVFGTDLSYRWSPPSRALYRGILWRTEILWSQKDDDLGQPHDAWGGYSFVEGLVARNLSLGIRLDRAGDPLATNDYEWGLLPYITWWQSEYVRLRGEYGYYRLEPAGDSENRLTLQLTFAAGPHKHTTY